MEDRAGGTVWTTSYRAGVNASQIAALTVGVVGGGTATALLTTSSERREKLRDRLIEASTQFLDILRTAVDALGEFDRRTLDEQVASERFLAATTAFRNALVEAERSGEAVEDLLLVDALLQVDLIRAGDFDTPWTAEEAAEVEGERSRVRAALDDLGDADTDVAGIDLGREWLDGAYEYRPRWQPIPWRVRGGRGGATRPELLR